LRFVWKLIFIIYNIFLMIFGGAVTLLALGYHDYFTSFVALTQFSTQNRMAALTIGLAAILIALIMILLMFYRRKKKVIQVTTETGHKITISMKAAQNMVLQSLLGVPGIREVTPEIHSSGKGIAVRLHVTVEARQNVPSLCEEMQKRVKDHLIHVSGLKVTHVTLLVENVVPVSRSRAATPAASKETQNEPKQKPVAESKKPFFASKKKSVTEEKKVKAAPTKPESEEKTVVETKTVETLSPEKKPEEKK